MLLLTLFTGTAHAVVVVPRVSHSQPEQSPVFGEIKAVYLCLAHETKCLPSFYGFNKCLDPEETFKQRAVRKSGHKDARVIGISDDKIYVTWSE